MSDQAPDKDLGATRRRLLAQLQSLSEPASILQLSDLLGLHENTVRFHLAPLEEAGLAVRTKGQATAGRPPDRYIAVPTAPSVDPRPYQQLAAVLVGHLAEQDAGEAERLGESWGITVAQTASPTTHALEGLVQVVGSLGFSSRVSDDGQRLEIHRCPYRELAQGDRRTICQIHLGVMRGYLDALDAPVRVTRLEPWVSGPLCLAHIEPRAEP